MPFYNQSFILNYSKVQKASGKPKASLKKKEKTKFDSLWEVEAKIYKV